MHWVAVLEHGAQRIAASVQEGSVAWGLAILSLAVTFGLGSARHSISRHPAQVSRACSFRRRCSGRFSGSSRSPSIRTCWSFYAIFALIFIYSVGLQVGPGFFTSLRAEGLRLNILAAACVGFGALMTAAIVHLFGLSHDAASGLYAGRFHDDPWPGGAVSRSGMLSLCLARASLRRRGGGGINPTRFPIRLAWLGRASGHRPAAKNLSRKGNRRGVGRVGREPEPAGPGNGRRRNNQSGSYRKDAARAPTAARQERAVHAGPGRTTRSSCRPATRKFASATSTAPSARATSWAKQCRLWAGRPSLTSKPPSAACAVKSCW